MLIYLLLGIALLIVAYWYYSRGMPQESKKEHFNVQAFFGTIGVIGGLSLAIVVAGIIGIIIFAGVNSRR